MTDSKSLVGARSSRVRLLLARMTGDTIPAVIAAIDEMVWEHWDDAEENRWIAAGKKTWGIDYDTEFKTVVAEFPEGVLSAAFETPVVSGDISL